MGLISEEVEVVLVGKNIKHYENLGYEIPRVKGKWGITVPHGSKIIVKIEDLTDGSSVRINAQCDNCEKIKNIKWIDYKKSIHDDKYYCNKCAKQLFGKEKELKTKLKNSKSFEQWCIINNKQDVLLRWDYKLNTCKPSDISYCTTKKLWFKCPNGIHKSELKNVQPFTQGINRSLDCKACNSFAQWGINNIGEDFLEKYWDNNNAVNPWVIPSQWNKKVIIKCQNKNYHGSYSVTCNSFVGSNVRCPYCNKNGGKVHHKDSLGQLLEYKGLLNLWSDKNNKSPFEYSQKSSKKVWWKCNNNKHKDYIRDIASSNVCNFRCPECQYSQGEERISDYFIKNIISYHPQKEFDGLVGLGNNPLSYDFYLPQFNLLIEYQGQQHEKYYKGFHKYKKDFEKQVEHDRRKREYAKDNNINLLEIWYYNFDNIENILNDKIKSIIT